MDTAAVVRAAAAVAVASHSTEYTRPASHWIVDATSARPSQLEAAAAAAAAAGAARAVQAVGADSG